MKKTFFTSVNAIATLFIVVMIATLAGCTNNENNSASKSEIDSLRNELKKFTDEKAVVAANLAEFDDLDFNIFTNQKWDRLHESHGDDIKVYWPDGHVTDGIKVHIEDLKGMFVYAPDLSIKVHPISFGSGEWVCAVGVMTGTFTKPMPIGGGKFIQPTGKKFSLTMCTVARWVNGSMPEEHLFWDNQSFMKQLGLAQ